MDPEALGTWTAALVLYTLNRSSHTKSSFKHKTLQRITGGSGMPPGTGSTSSPRSSHPPTPTLKSTSHPGKHNANGLNPWHTSMHRDAEFVIPAASHTAHLWSLLQEQCLHCRSDGNLGTIAPATISTGCLDLPKLASSGAPKHFATAAAVLARPRWKLNSQHRDLLSQAGD